MAAFKYKNLAILSAILLFFIFSLSACGSSEKITKIKVPVNLQDAQGIKSIHLELLYDPYLLKVLKAERGDLAEDSIFAYGSILEGGLTVGLTADGKMDGSGSIAIITFAITPLEGGSANMLLSNVQVYAVDGSKLQDIQLIDGYYSYADKALVAPSIVCPQK